MHKTLSLAAVIVALAPQGVLAQDGASPGALASEVAQLRAEVEALRAEMRALRTNGAAAAPASASASPLPPVATPLAAATMAAKDAAPPVQITFKGAPEFKTADGWSFKPRGRLQVDASYLS